MFVEDTNFVSFIIVFWYENKLTLSLPSSLLFYFRVRAFSISRTRLPGTWRHLPPKAWVSYGAKIPGDLACVASVSVWFRSKEIPRKTFGFDRARNETRAKKWKRGEGVSFLSSPPPPRSFTCATFLAVFDSRSSFFSPKPHRNACYAGYRRLGFYFSPSIPDFAYRYRPRLQLSRKMA